MTKTYEHLVGHRFPGGTTRVPGWMNALWADSVEATNPAPYVHPVLVYVAAVEGGRTTFQQMFDLMEADADSGLLFGEQYFEFTGPVEMEREYLVEGGITSVERKEGRRTGAFDLMTFELRLLDPDTCEQVALELDDGRLPAPQCLIVRRRQDRDALPRIGS